MILRFNTSKKYKITVILLTILLSITLMSCTGEPKYTYEEYKKIKALSTGKETEYITEDKLEDNANKDKLQSFSDDLGDYNS